MRRAARGRAGGGVAPCSRASAAVMWRCSSSLALGWRAARCAPGASAQRRAGRATCARAPLPARIASGPRWRRFSAGNATFELSRTEAEVAIPVTELSLSESPLLRSIPRQTINLRSVRRQSRSIFKLSHNSAGNSACSSSQKERPGIPR